MRRRLCNSSNKLVVYGTLMVMICHWVILVVVQFLAVVIALVMVVMVNIRKHGCRNPSSTLVLVVGTLMVLIVESYSL